MLLDTTVVALTFSRPQGNSCSGSDQQTPNLSRASRSRLLRVSSVCRTSSLVVSGVSKLARHPSTISAVHSPSQRSCALSASLCVEPSCSRHHPCSTGSWDLGIPISLWVFCPLWVSAQLHSLWGRRESIPACRVDFHPF